MEQELPKYMILVNWIKEQVFSNQLKYGEKLYSENELSTMFSISRQTVRQAIGILEQESILERRRGSGTYIIYTPQNQRKKTMNIGVISTYLDSYIFPSIINGIERVLSKNQYSMQLSFTRNREENERRSLYSMIENQVDGLIVEPTKSGLPNSNESLYEEIKNKHIPLIFFNAYYPGTSFPHVSMNDRAAGKIAANHLIEAGHRRIAGIFQSDDLQGHLRYAGFMSALREADIEQDSGNILWFSTEDIPFLAEDFNKVLRCIENTTGLVCYNDQIAFSVITELRKRYVNIPDKISVIGVDNSDLASICEVPFTSVAHPMDELGITVAENMIQLIQNPRFQATVEFDPHLIKRDSVRTLNPV